MNRQQNIHKTYVITLLDHQQSMVLSDRAIRSCEQNNMDVQLWPAFDGTKNSMIRVPESLVGQQHIGFLKMLNHKLCTAEVAVWLSHYSLWCYCLSIDKPIIILEHDAVMLKPCLYHETPNTIAYLGHEWQQQKQDVPCDVDIEGYGYKFIRGAHAYSIDSSAAKNLIAAAIREGITRPLDVFMRSDIFAIVQHDVYATHKNDHTTLGDRIFFQEIERYCK